MKKGLKIGFIGQGYVGKSYADNFESRGFEVVRYSLEPQYIKNKAALKKCQIAIIAVPTNTIKGKHDVSIVDSALKLLAPKTIAIIKSTIIPGTTAALQKMHKKLVILHSPEFLTASTARDDVDHAPTLVIGKPSDSDVHAKSANTALKILPKAAFSLICSSTESEFIKYATNTFYYAKVVYMNTLYDLAKELGLDWSKIKSALASNPWIGPMHIEPVHKTGRGAGGHCLIKDYAAFRAFYESTLPSAKHHHAFMRHIEKHNLHLLKSTKKDLEILEKVYGKKVS